MKDFAFKTHMDLRTRDRIVVVEHQPNAVYWQFPQIQGRGKTYAQALANLALAIESDTSPEFDLLRK